MMLGAGCSDAAPRSGGPISRSSESGLEFPPTSVGDRRRNGVRWFHRRVAEDRGHRGRQRRRRVAYASMIDGVADEIALYDIDGPGARAEVLDLRHGLQFVGGGRVAGADDPAVCADADLVVVTAGASSGPGRSRLSWPRSTPGWSARCCRRCSRGRPRRSCCW